MDLSCIISSGDLELSILGMLSSEDASKIEQLAKLFPEIKAELDEIENALLNAANKAEEAPSAAVKDALFSRLRELPVNAAPASADGTAEVSEEYAAKVVPMYQPKRRNSGLIAAAVIGLLLGITALAYTFISNNRQHTQMTAMQQKADSLQNQTAMQQQKITDYAKNLHFYQDTSYRMINLLPIANRPKDMLVQILWDKKTNTVYAAAVSLPKAPEGKQYQLWAIVNGKPVSAGMLNEKIGTVEAMRVFNRAEAFAITLEKAGGVASPTLTEMYVMGKV